MTFLMSWQKCECMTLLLFMYYFCKTKRKNKTAPNELGHQFFVIKTYCTHECQINWNVTFKQDLFWFQHSYLYIIERKLNGLGGRQPKHFTKACVLRDNCSNIRYTVLYNKNTNHKLLKKCSL